jgi:hypothetical protein
MLDLTLEERINPTKEILDLLEKTDYRVINGAIKTLEGTNVKFVMPVQYIISKPKELTILEYRVTEIANKPFVIEQENQKYSLKEIKKLLDQLTK